MKQELMNNGKGITWPPALYLSHFLYLLQWYCYSCNHIWTDPSLKTRILLQNAREPCGWQWICSPRKSQTCKRIVFIDKNTDEHFIPFCMSSFVAVVLKPFTLSSPLLSHRCRLWVPSLLNELVDVSKQIHHCFICICRLFSLDIERNWIYLSLRKYNLSLTLKERLYALLIF